MRQCRNDLPASLARLLLLDALPRKWQQEAASERGEEIGLALLAAWSNDAPCRLVAAFCLRTAWHQSSAAPLAVLVPTLVYPPLDIGLQRASHSLLLHPPPACRCS